jgi:hypothetical protein
MLAFVVVGVSVDFLNRLHQFVPLMLLNGAGYRPALEPSQWNALAMVFFDVHESGEMIATLFFGLWLLPLGLLVIKSGLIPRIMGVLLIIGGACHGMNFLAFFLLPGYTGVVDTALSLGAIGEFVFVLWLLVKGVRERNVTGNS